MQNSRLLGRLFTLCLLLITLPKYYFQRIFSTTKNNKNNNINRILVLHNLLLGDSILILPLLAKLRQNYPYAEIVLALPKAFIELFNLSPYNIKTIEFNPKDIATILNLYKIARENNTTFDIGILPAENRYSLLLRAIGVKNIIAFEKDTAIWKNFLVDTKITFPSKNTAFADFILDLLPKHLETIDNTNKIFFDNTKWLVKNNAFTEKLPKKQYIVLHLGAGNSTRLWNIESWIKVAEHLLDATNKTYEIVFTCGKAEKFLVNLVENQQNYLFNTKFAGNTTLLELFILLQNSQMIISLDTGIAHLARLTGIPNIIIFGPGSAEIYGNNGYFWSNQITKIITKSDAEIPCRNGKLLLERNHLKWVKHCCISAEQCCKIHNLKYSKSSFIAQCMQKITPNEVVQTALSLLPNLPKNI